MERINCENKFLITLSEIEMLNCYGGGFISDIFKWIADSYVELKKGIIDGFKAK